MYVCLFFFAASRVLHVLKIHVWILIPQNVNLASAEYLPCAHECPSCLYPNISMRIILHVSFPPFLFIRFSLFPIDFYYIHKAHIWLIRFIFKCNATQVGRNPRTECSGQRTNFIETCHWWFYDFYHISLWTCYKSALCSLDACSEQTMPIWIHITLSFRN